MTFSAVLARKTAFNSGISRTENIDLQCLKMCGADIDRTKVVNVFFL